MTKKLDYKKTLNETKEKLTMGKNPFESKIKNKVLSDDEIKQLLDAISSKEPKEEKEEKYSRKIKIYDSRRPDVLSLNNVKDVDTIFDKIAQSWSRFDCLKNEAYPAVHVLKCWSIKIYWIYEEYPNAYNSLHF